MTTLKTNIELEQYNEHVGIPMDGISYLAVPYFHQDDMVMNARLQAIKYITDALVRNRYIVFSPILYNKEIEDRSKNRPPEGWWLFNQNYLLASRSFVLVELPGWEKDEDVIIKFDLARKLGKDITRFAWIDDPEKGGGIKHTLEMGFEKAGVSQTVIEKMINLIESAGESK